MDEIIWRDALGQAAAIQAGDIAAVELLDAYLQRIEALDGELRTIVALDEAGARAAARAVDERRRTDPASLPPFAGVPLSIKDTDDVEGLPTTESCELFAHRVAAKDGPVLGIHIVGERVGELIAEAQLIYNWEALPSEVAQLIHPHPTQSEAIGEAHLLLAGKPLHVHD